MLPVSEELGHTQVCFLQRPFIAMCPRRVDNTNGGFSSKVAFLLGTRPIRNSVQGWADEQSTALRFGFPASSGGGSAGPDRNKAKLIFESIFLPIANVKIVCQLPIVRFENYCWNNRSEFWFKRSDWLLEKYGRPRSHIFVSGKFRIWRRRTPKKEINNIQCWLTIIVRPNANSNGRFKNSD